MEPLHLSRFTLDPRAKDVRRGLVNPYELHRTIVALSPAVEGRRSLWRLEPASTEDPRPRLLLQTPAEPLWAALPPGWGDPQSRRIDGFLSRLAKGDRLRFRLRANATNDRAENGQRRVALATPGELLAWLLCQGDIRGFAIPRDADGWHEVQVTIRPPVAIVRKAGQRLALPPRLFEGRLEVVDPDRLRTAVERGLGRGRAFGLGLLSLAPE
jgi:CRISPR system Cascade subunit CasE